MAAIDCVGEVDTSWTTVGEVEVNQYVEGLSFEVNNAAGGQTLTDFRVRVKTDYYGGYVSFIGGTDFDSIANPNVLFCSTTGPHELTADSSALVRLRMQMRVYSIDFQAKVASGSTWVKVLGDTF